MQLHLPPPLVELLLNEGQSLGLPPLSQALGSLPHLGLSLQERLLLADHLTLILSLLCLQQCPESGRKGGREGGNGEKGEGEKVLNLLTKLVRGYKQDYNIVWHVAW